jgi:hypothetical protein
MYLGINCRVKVTLNLPCCLNVAHTTLDGQIAAQQDLLVRQAAEIQELNNVLNETIHKVYLSVWLK